MRGSDPEYIRAFGGCKHFLLYDGGALRLFLLANLPQIILKVCGTALDPPHAPPDFGRY